MRETPPPTRAVVVGIDGSRKAIDSALWAVAEAVDRDVPLRLVYAIEPNGTTSGDPQTYAQDFGMAECAIRQAVTAVESTNQPVKIEAEIVRSTATSALLEASRTADMLCVGAVGLNGAAGRRGGSTAAAVSTRARCPVAIVRGGWVPTAGDAGWIVTAADGDPDDTVVVARAVEEARMRSAPLRVVSSRRLTFADVHDAQAAEDGRRLAKASLERSLGRWRAVNPGMVIESEAVTGDLVDYVAHHADDVQLIVVGHDRRHGVADVTGPLANSALHGTHCSVLVAEPHRAL